MGDREARALVVALELLRRQIANPAGSVLANAARRPDDPAPGWVSDRGLSDRGRVTRDTSYVDTPSGTRVDPTKVVLVEDRTARPGRPDGGFRAAPQAAAATTAPAAAGRALNPLTSVAGALAGKFAAMLGPLAVIHSALSSNASGFQVVGTAMRVLGATLGPILLPVFVLLAAAVVALSDVIWRHLLPNLGALYGFVLNTAVPAMVRWVAEVNNAVEAIKYFARWVRDPVGAARDEVRTQTGGEPGGKGIGSRGLDALPYVMPFPFALPGFAYPMRKAREVFGVSHEAGGGAPRDTDWGERDLGRRGRDVQFAWKFFGPGGLTEQRQDPGTANPQKVVNDALRDVVRSLQLSLLPKAQFSALTQVGQQAQLAALNADPLEQKAIRRGLQALEELLKAIAQNTKQPATQVFGGDE